MPSPTSIFEKIRIHRWPGTRASSRSAGSMLRAGCSTRSSIPRACSPPTAACGRCVLS